MSPPAPYGVLPSDRFTNWRKRFWKAEQASSSATGDAGAPPASSFRREQRPFLPADLAHEEREALLVQMWKALTDAERSRYIGRDHAKPKSSISPMDALAKAADAVGGAAPPSAALGHEARSDAAVDGLAALFGADEALRAAKEEPAPPPPQQQAPPPPQQAPPPSQQHAGPPARARLQDEPWFHGLVDRSQVGALLPDAGSFLVRESTKNPGEFTASVWHSGKVKNLPISVCMGDKYTFGNGKPEFSSVGELIDHYVASGATVKGARLVTPAPRQTSTPGPDAPKERKKRRKRRAGAGAGAAEAGATRDVAAELDSEPWFHGKIDKALLKGILLQPGDYIVRESAKQSGELAISVLAGGKIQHFIIKRDSKGRHRVNGDSFATVGELLDHHSGYTISVSKTTDVMITAPIARTGGLQKSQVQELPRPNLDAVGWFHGKLGRSDPTLPVLLKDQGAYLLRESSKKPGEFVVSVQSGSKIQHVNLKQSAKGWSFGQQVFGTIVELLNYHIATQTPITGKGAGAGAVVSFAVLKGGQSSTAPAQPARKVPKQAFQLRPDAPNVAQPAAQQPQPPQQAQQAPAPPAGNAPGNTPRLACLRAKKFFTSILGRTQGKPVWGPMRKAIIRVVQREMTVDAFMTAMNLATEFFAAIPKIAADVALMDAPAMEHLVAHFGAIQGASTV